MSYLRGPTDDPLLDVTFGQLLDDRAARWPDREAYVFKKTGSRITFAELKHQVDRIASGLRAVGTGRGDVVAWLFGHRREWIYFYLAVAKLGAIVLPLQAVRLEQNMESTKYVLNKAGVKVLVVGDIPGVGQADGTIPYLCSLFPEIKTSEPGKLHIPNFPALSCIIVIGGNTEGIGVYTMEDVQRIGNNEKLLTEVSSLQGKLSCHDTFLLSFTSGSTGLPKCAESSTYAVLNNFSFTGKAVGITDEGATLQTATLIRCTIVYALTAGCTVVVTASQSPSSVEIMETIQEEKCQSISALFMKECHDFFHNPHLGEYDLSSLKRVFVTGNVVPKSLLDRAAKVLPDAKMFVGYGASEVLCITVTPADMTVEGKGSVVGKLLQHLEIQLVDEEGQTVPLGHEGEVWVRGYSMLNRYRGDERKTSEAKTADGWYKTGDVGVLDDDGVLKLFGRLSAVIIRDAFNVHPTVVEFPLLKHPKVQDVRVVGVPDPTCVEEICACIILKEGQSADSKGMRKFCGEIGMLPMEIPGYFIFIGDFPMTSTRRKVDRKKLREVAMEKLGLKEEE